jgi:small-conductance mechanosensitive channel
MYLIGETIMFLKSTFDSRLLRMWFDLWQRNLPIGKFVEETPPPVIYLITLLGIFFLLLLIPIFNKIFLSFHQSFERWCHKRLSVVRFFSMELMLPKGLIHSLVGMTKYVRSLIILGLLLLSIFFVGNVFPGTRNFMVSFLENIVVFLVKVWDAFVAYLPDLVALFVIIVLTHYALKFLRFVADGIKQEKIRISGVHLDLIDPTYQLLRFFVVAFAVVAAYPYIPGSESPVFRGISIFVGFLLSLGSTSLVSNIIAGIVLTYTRGLRIGDRVEIGEAVGDVIDRNLLVTRISTIKNVIITIPNGKVLSGYIVNYSSSASDKGLILNTTVTIGYDVSWRKVHQLLIDAALATPGIQKLPKPFVLQTSLDDYYVSYELNAYTKDPSWMAVLYSRLHQNIQDQFTDAGVEIMSPGYMAYRNGTPVAIPPDPYLDSGYTRFFHSKRFVEEETRPIVDQNGNGNNSKNNFSKRFFEEDTRPIAD